MISRLGLILGAAGLLAACPACAQLPSASKGLVESGPAVSHKAKRAGTALVLCAGKVFKPKRSQKTWLNPQPEPPRPAGGATGLHPSPELTRPTPPAPDGIRR
jgi:hypothetical protein